MKRIDEEYPSKHRRNERNEVIAQARIIRRRVYRNDPACKARDIAHFAESQRAHIQRKHNRLNHRPAIFNGHEMLGDDARSSAGDVVMWHYSKIGG